jgi:RimJ/RimL family protein N-acetyltransferase
VLKGKRINLRLVRDEDECRTWYAAYNDLAHRAFTDHTEIYSLQTVLKRFAEDGLWGKGQGTLLITNKQETIVGSIGFSRSSDFECDIGYRIYKEEHRGQGYMSEALPLFSAYLFATIPTITRLRILTASDNTPSRQLAEKSGYTQEGVLRKAYFHRGKICDWVIYGMLREECPDFSERFKEQGDRDNGTTN